LQGPILDALRALPDRDSIAGNLLANLQALGQDTTGAGAALQGLEALSRGAAEEKEPDFLAGLGPADLRMLGPLEQALGIQKGGPTSDQLAALRAALLGLPPEVQLSLMAGLAQLPGPPEGLALGLKALSAEVMAAATITALAGGASWSQLRGPIQGVLNLLPDRKSLVRAFASHLRSRGMDPTQAEPILRDLAWDDLSLEAKLLKILEHGFLFELSLEQRLALLRELLDLRRFDEFIRIQEVLLEALRSEWPDLRMKAAKTLGGMARWAHQPGLPPEADGPLTKALREHFALEPDHSIHHWTVEALDTLLAARVLRGDLLGALSDLQELGTLSAFKGQQHPWQVHGITRLHAALARRELLDAAVDHFLLLDRLQLSLEAPPYLAATGDSLLQHLLARLEGEPDRTTRGRLVEVIRTVGPTALPSLLNALGSSAWYLVRNALTLLAELGNTSCLPAITPLLNHPEPRVRRTAVRALWKLGGSAVETPLLGRMKETDAEAMQELLFAFGQLRSERCVGPVAELAQDKRVLERLRIQALETLANIASPKAMPALLECMRRKGFFSPGEPSAIRMAAAKALAAMGTTEARAALRKAADAEPKGEERDLLHRLLKGSVAP
jgi:HEAT repeat protein